MVVRRVLLLGALLLASVASAGPSASGIPPLQTPGTQAQLDEALAAYARGAAQLKNGETAQGTRELDRAIEQLRGLIDVEPRAWVHYALGQALRRRGDCEHAIEAYRHALERADGETFTPVVRSEFVNRTKQQIANCVVEMGPQARPPATTPATSPDIVTTPPSTVVPAAIVAPPVEKELPARRPWSRDPAAGLLLAFGLAGAAGGGALLGWAESLAAASPSGLQAHLDAGNVLAQRGGGVALITVGAALVLGSVIRWAVVARRGPQAR